MNSTKQYMNSTNSAWTVNPCEVTVHVQKKKKKKKKKRENADVRKRGMQTVT